MISAYAQSATWSQRLFYGFVKQPLGHDEQLDEVVRQFLRTDPVELRETGTSLEGHPCCIYGMLVGQDEYVPSEIVAIVWGDGAFLIGERADTPLRKLAYTYQLVGSYEHQLTYQIPDGSKTVAVEMSDSNGARIEATVRAWETMFEYHRTHNETYIYRTKDEDGWENLGGGARKRSWDDLGTLYQLLRVLGCR